MKNIVKLSLVLGLLGLFGACKTGGASDEEQRIKELKKEVEALAGMTKAEVEQKAEELLKKKKDSGLTSDEQATLSGLPRIYEPLLRMEYFPPVLKKTNAELDDDPTKSAGLKRQAGPFYFSKIVNDDTHNARDGYKYFVYAYLKYRRSGVEALVIDESDGGDKTWEARKLGFIKDLGNIAEDSAGAEKLKKDFDKAFKEFEDKIKNS